jgi:16S rRNA processing protein RimM
MPQGITIAHIARPWGNKGEVTADILTDFPERFEAVSAVTLRRGGAERAARLERFRFHKGRVVLKFEGSDSISDAETLANFDVVIPEEELHRLPEGEGLYYDFQLVGCAVVDRAGGAVGEVRGVMRTGAGAILEVKRPKGPDALIPFVDEMCPEVDVAAKRITVELPEGLLEL